MAIVKTIKILSLLHC